MANKLKNLILNEVSAVDQGANQKANFLMFKSKGTKAMTPSEIEKKLSESESALTKANATVESLTADIAKSKTEIETISKSLEAANAEIAKRDEEIAKRDSQIKELVEKAEQAALISEVQKMFPHTKGTDIEKAAVLKSVHAISDEAVRKNALEALNQAEAFAASFAKKTGSSPSSGDEDMVEDAKGYKKKFDSLVQKNMKETGANRSNAISSVLKTEEGKKLYESAKAK